MRIKLLVWTVNTLVILVFLFSFLFLSFNLRTSTEPEPFCAVAICGNFVHIPDSLMGEYEKGKNLFKSNCATCHNRNMVDDLTGPALRGVLERWKDYPREDLYRWIRNSQGMVSEGHPKAVALFNDWQSIMTSFPNLRDEDIEAILIYIEADY